MNSNGKASKEVHFTKMKQTLRYMPSSEHQKSTTAASQQNARAGEWLGSCLWVHPRRHGAAVLRLPGPVGHCSLHGSQFQLSTALLHVISKLSFHQYSVVVPTQTAGAPFSLSRAVIVKCHRYHRDIAGQITEKSEEDHRTITEKSKQTQREITEKSQRNHRKITARSAAHRKITGTLTNRITGIITKKKVFQLTSVFALVGPHKARNRSSKVALRTKKTCKPLQLLTALKWQMVPCERKEMSAA